MRHVDIYFAVSGILLVIAGMGLGVFMGIAQEFAYRSVHAHINLIGWVSFLLFALAYRVGLARCDHWASVHFGLAVAGVVLLAPGIYLATVGDTPLLAIVGSVLTLASMVVFLANCLRAAPS